MLSALALENLLYVWLPAFGLVATVTTLRFRLAHRLRWKQMVLRLTATHMDDDVTVSERQRQVLSDLLSNVTLLSALGSTLSLSLMMAPTEVFYVEDEVSGDLVSRSIAAQYFIFLSFASTGNYVVVVSESALTMLYLEQFSDFQLHALLCEKAAQLFVEPLLSFVSATIYMLGSAVIFCYMIYGPEAGIGLAIIAPIPMLKVVAAWHHLESFDKRSFAISRRLEQGEDPGQDAPGGPRARRPASITRSVTVVGQSKLLDAMKEKSKERRREAMNGRFSFRVSPRSGGAAIGASGRSRSRTILPKQIGSELPEDDEAPPTPHACGQSMTYPMETPR